MTRSSATLQRCRTMPIGEYTSKFDAAFFDDMEALGVERPESHCARDRKHRRDGGTDRAARREDIAYKAEDGSWYFRIAKFPEYGKLVQERLRRHRGRCARRTWMSMRRMPRVTSPCGRPYQARRKPRGKPRSGTRAAGLAHRVLRHGDEVSRRKLRPACRRRRSDLPAPRKRDCAERMRDAPVPSRGTGFTCASCWSKARRCPSPRATSTRCATCC